jgi:hypothetical protein
MATAALQIRAGVSTAGGAPIKLTAGSLLAAPEAGAIEFDGTDFYITDGTPVRHKIVTDNNSVTFSSKTIASSGLTWTGGSAPSLSSAGSAKTYYDNTTNTYRISENGGAYADVLTAGRALQSPLSTKTAAYTITSNDSIILANTSGGTFAITLPSAVGINGKQHTIKQISATNFATVATTGAQTIDGLPGYSFSTQYESITVASDGANWVIISNK